MKIFVPSNSKSTYLNEINFYSKLDFQFQNFSNFDDSYDIVNIHWPEAIFDWLEPTKEEIEILKEEIIKWKKSAIIVYTKHDRERVKGWTKNFKILFQIIEENSDVFIHLGEFSRKIYLKKYPEKRHEIIPHPTFESSFEKISKEQARKELGINQKALVITVPGQIRSRKERALLLKSFRKLSHTNKVLISTNMRNEMEWDFPGRIRIKNLFNIKSYIKGSFEDKHQPPEYIFSYLPQDKYNFSIRIAAADIIFIPRIDLLNTGNVLLGLTFNKVTVGPAIGNIKEQLEEHNLPVFDPKSISSAVKAIEEGIELYLKGQEPVANDKYRAVNVSLAYDDLFIKLLNRDS